MDWSIGLLGEPVLRLYRRLGVIAGMFAPSTAASILERGERRGLAPLGIGVSDGLDAAGRRIAPPAAVDDHGYAMLTTVRDDALERLRAAGEHVAMRWAHAYEVLAMVEAAEVQLPTAREVEALDRLDEAHDDIREALDWATEQGDGTFAVRMTGALAEFWRTRGHHTEGRLRLASALALAPDAPAPYRRKALGGAGLLASYQGDYALGEAYLREALAASRQDGDEEAEAIILNWLGTNAYGRGDLDAAEGYVSESLVLRRRIGDPAGIASDAQRPWRRLPLPRRPRPGPRDVRREPRAQAGARQRELARGLADEPRARGARRRPPGDGRRRLRGGDRDLGADRRPAAGGRRAPQRRPARPRPASPRRGRWPPSTAPTTSRASWATGPRWRTRWSTGRGSTSSAVRSTRRRPTSPRRCPGPSGSVRGSSSRSGSRPPAASPRRAGTMPWPSGCGRPRPASARTAASRTCRPTSGTSTSGWPQVRERLDPGTFADAWAEGADLGAEEATAQAMLLVGGRVAEPLGRDRQAGLIVPRV